MGSVGEDTGERLVDTQALSLTKNPQNQARLPRFCNCALNLERKLAAAIWRRNLNVWNMFSGDVLDRTANLLVANQALSQLSCVSSKLASNAERFASPRAQGHEPQDDRTGELVLMANCPVENSERNHATLPLRRRPAACCRSCEFCDADYARARGRAAYATRPGDVADFHAGAPPGAQFVAWPCI